MSTAQIPKPEERHRGDSMEVISITPVGPNTYEVVTRSAKYGEVTQTILMLSGADAKKLRRHLGDPDQAPPPKG